jgi:hypothetical protein
MVRLRNRSDRKSVELRVGSDGETIARPVELPSSGEEKDYFVDLPRVGQVIAVELRADPPDDLAADDRAWLVRQRKWPTLEPASSLPPELRRMIEVYGKHRPASEGSGHVVVTDDLSGLGSGRAAAGVARGDERLRAGDQPVRVVEHPVTTSVKWSEVVADATIAARPPGDGWTPIVSVGSATLVAVRESPARQVWVGFASPTFARRANYVVFWTSVFDWIAAGGEPASDEFTARPVQQLGEGWTRRDDLCGPAATAEPSAGVYQGPAGELVAMNAINIALRTNPPSSSDWSEFAQSGYERRAFELSSALLIAAMVAMLAAVAAWGMGVRHPRNGPGAGRHDASAGVA